MGTIHKIKYIFNRKQKFNLVLLIVLILIGSILELVGVSAILPLVDIAMKPESIRENSMYVSVSEWLGIESANEFIIFLAIVLAFLYFVKNMYLILYKKFQFTFTYDISRSIAVKLMDSYLHQDYLFHVAHNVAELQRNVSTDVNQFVMTVTAVINMAVEGCTCLFLVILLIATDPMTTIMVIGILGVVVIIYWRISRKLQVRYGMEARKAGTDLTKWLLQSFGGIKEIKVLNRESFFLGNYDKAYQKNNVAYRKYNIIGMMPKYIIETIIICSLLLIMSIRIIQGTEIQEFVSTLSVFALAAMRILPSFNRITENMSTVMFNKSGVENVFSDLKEIEKLERKNALQQQDIEKLQIEKEIRIENLTFAYPGSDKKVFENANLIIGKNKSIAFVGSSGAGKTTLADIIIGVLEPDEGHVFVDDTDVFTHLNAWHKTIGYIPQMIYLMDDTIRANVVFGVPEAEIDDDKVWDALRRAELADFVESLKDGIYTEIGDRGVKLSGGQRQRIGIARALYFEPEVLILDEATSALDNETEAAVMESIDSLHGNTTMIIIAHRLSTISSCDEVYEVEDGKISLKK